MSAYQVFTLMFSSIPVDHKALFVLLRGEEDDAEGYLLNVRGPGIDPKTRRANMRYEKTTQKPFKTAAIDKTGTRLVGTVPSSKLDDLIKVCEGVTPPSRPMTQRTPNCVTWVANVLVQLKKKGIIDVSPQFSEMPAAEVPLMV